MKEIVFISGKGGTGKTTIITSIFNLFEKSILVDADVSTSNDSLFFKGSNILSQTEVQHKSIHEIENCIGCGKCKEVCQFDAIKIVNTSDGKKAKVIDVFCTACEYCSFVCPVEAIYFEEKKAATLNVMSLDEKYIIFGDLEIGVANSGKIVTNLRELSKKFGEKNNIDIVLIDSACGLGCDVKAAINNSNFVFVLVEPTSASYADFIQTTKLLEFFKIPYAIIINKCGLNKDWENKFKSYANNFNLLVFKISYNKQIFNFAKKGYLAVLDKNFLKEVKQIFNFIRKELYNESSSNYFNKR